MDKLTIINDTLISEQVRSDIAGQLGEKSKRIYEYDAKAFAAWIQGQGLIPAQLTRSDMIAYRSYLLNEKNYAKPTAHRMFSVASRILREYVYNGTFASSPADGVDGIKVSGETTHTVLTKKQAGELINAVDVTSVKGLRDRAILMLLVYTGIRRMECVALNIGSMVQSQGHTIISIEHGKGDEPGVAKLPVKVKRAIDAYLTAAHRENCSPASPLFVRFNKGDRPSENRLVEKSIEMLVKSYGAMIGVPELTPHGLRATFITLSLEEGAKLQQVQYAARHKDPRTTEGYQKRKLNLDDNAVDYIRLDV